MIGAVTPAPTRADGRGSMNFLLKTPLTLFAVPQKGRQS